MLPYLIMHPSNSLLIPLLDQSFQKINLIMSHLLWVPSGLQESLSVWLTVPLYDSTPACLSASFPHVPLHFWTTVNNPVLYPCSSFIRVVNVLWSLLCATHCTRCRWCRYETLPLQEPTLLEEDRQNREEHLTQSENWS